jgi:hypothetical protein
MMTDAFVLGGVRTPFAQLTPRWSMNRSRNATWTDPIPTMAHGDCTTDPHPPEGVDRAHHRQRRPRSPKTWAHHSGNRTRAKLAMFIFVATNTVRHGMLSQERRRAPKWVDYIDLRSSRAAPHCVSRVPQ